MESTLELKKAHRCILKLHKEIRKYSIPNLNFRTLSSEILYKEWMRGKTVKRAVFFLPVIYGCSWKHKCGGCFNCGMSGGVNIKLLPVLLVKPIIDRLSNWAINEEKVPWVCIYNEGSFLNPEELHPLAQKIILEIIAGTGFVKRITIESRPEFITEETVESLAKIASYYKVEVEIGIGVEIRNDFIRKYSINKGFSWNSFKEKVKIIRQYTNLRSLAYVLLKPLFLTECEAIRESVKTIQECFRIGVNVVSLETMSIQNWTLVEYLWLMGFYELPMLWSVIEVIINVKNLGEVRIGGEPATYFPQSLTVAHNCDKCTKRIWKNFRRYNETYALRYLTENSCRCKKRWRQIVNQSKKDNKIEEEVREKIITIGRLSLPIEDYIKRKIFIGGTNNEEYTFYNFERNNKILSSVKNRCY